MCLPFNKVIALSNLFTPIAMSLKEGENLLVEYHSAGFQTFGFWQCTLGTVGGAGTSTLAGMGIGAIAATPATVLGEGVFGGIAGGMTGASASCFN